MLFVLTLNIGKYSEKLTPSFVKVINKLVDRFSRRD